MTDKLTVLTYNFYCRPHFIFKDNQGIRAKLLAFKIKEYERINNVRIDVVCLQEIFNNFFSDKVYKTINKEMAKIGFIFRTKRVKTWRLPINGGSYILSRHIITDKDTLCFDSTKSSIFNIMAAKGVSYGKIKYQNKDFHIISTHLDSFESVFRKKQMIEIKKFLAKKKVTNNIIIAGDFNINFWGSEMNNVDEVFPDYDYPDLIYEKDTFDQFSMNGKFNEWIGRRKNKDTKKEQSYLDFFCVKSDDIKCSDMKAIALRQEQMANDILLSTDFLMNVYKDKKTIKIKDLSDHYAVLGNFYF